MQNFESAMTDGAPEFQNLVDRLTLPPDFDELKSALFLHGRADSELPEAFADGLRQWFANSPLFDRLSPIEVERVEKLISEAFDPLWALDSSTRSGLMKALHESGDKTAPLHSVMEESVVKQVQLFLKALKLELMRQYQSSRDALTGLYNRRYFEEELKRAIAFWERSNFNPGKEVEKNAHAVLLFDLDYFKKINDRYGHNAGDAALKHFAHVLEKHVRREDVAARWGGEEFVILLRFHEANEPILAANRLREAVKAADFIFEGQKIPITVSVGVAVVNNPEASVIIKKADEGLYRAKAEGRDRVCQAA